MPRLPSVELIDYLIHYSYIYKDVEISQLLADHILSSGRSVRFYSYTAYSYGAVPYYFHCVWLAM